MNAFSFALVLTFFFAGPALARNVEMTAEQFMKKGIPYCTKKIKRGCIQPKDGNTAKYYLAPQYQEKNRTAKAISLKSKSKSKNLVKNKLKSKTKNLAKGKKTSLPKYSKLKNSKRDIASVLEQKLKKHREKKVKK